MPPGPGTETTGRIRPPGNASHSRGPSVAASSGTLPMTTIVRVASACSTQDRSAAAGAAPTWREVTFPSRITSSVGMDCTPKRCWSLGESSTLTFTSLRRPAMSVATCASAGLTMRHGPHQGAHRSTTTGTDARSATSAKVSSPASTIQGSGLWQLPQRGTPEAAAGTRFLRPQFGHRMGPCSPSRPTGLLKGRFEDRDPVQQVGDQPDGRVVEAESGPEPLDPAHGRHLAAGEPQLARGVPVGVQDAQGDEPADQVRVRARGPRERLQVEAHRPDQDQRVAHYRLLGSKVETVASSSKSRRSSSASLAGTTILTSAYRCPALPRG